LSREFGAPTSVQEYMAELNYGITLAPWLNLRPGVQYIWHPSGINEIPNALVLDLKTVLTF
jgi:porin